MALIALGAFVFAGVRVLMLQKQYAEEREAYDQLASEYTQPAEVTDRAHAGASEDAGDGTAGGSDEGASGAPITVDFDALVAQNPDIFAWIYCEGTAINYPVVYGRDNSYYEHRDPWGNNLFAGSIFSDASNAKGVVDSNLILYGHHMKDGSMFAALKFWFNQDFYDEHPVMWLLTPQGDYRVELFSCYVTNAWSDVYTIFLGPSTQLEEWLTKAKSRSVFTSDVTLERDAHYVMLSTCTEAASGRRTVVYGKLVPVD